MIRHDRGSASLELVILLPALVIVMLLIIVAGRVSHAHGTIEAAARDAARQASLARDPVTARSRAITSARAALEREGLNCDPQVTVDTSGFERPVGTVASVSATVSCVVDLSDLTDLAIPGSQRLTSHFASPLDPYRGRDDGLTNSEGSSVAHPSVGGVP